MVNKKAINTEMWYVRKGSWDFLEGNQEKHEKI
jgi:hypothetical protein